MIGAESRRASRSNLGRHNHVYEDIASKFFEHFLSIADVAMSSMASDGIGAMG